MIAIQYSKDIPRDELALIFEDIQKLINTKKPDEVVIVIPNKMDIDFDYSIEELKQLRDSIDQIIKQYGEQ